MHSFCDGVPQNPVISRKHKTGLIHVPLFINRDAIQIDPHNCKMWLSSLKCRNEGGLRRTYDIKTHDALSLSIDS